MFLVNVIVILNLDCDTYLYRKSNSFIIIHNNCWDKKIVKMKYFMKKLNYIYN